MAISLYGSVNGTSKKIRKLYGSVLNVSSLGQYTTQSTSTPTFVPNGLGDLVDESIFLSKIKEKFPYWADQFLATHPHLMKITDFYEVSGFTGGTNLECSINFYGRDASRTTRLLYTYTTQTLSDFVSYCASWGLTVNPAIQSESTRSGTGIDFPDAVMENMSKEIVKLYGSVNGLTKRIF